MRTNICFAQTDKSLSQMNSVAWPVITGHSYIQGGMCACVLCSRVLHFTISFSLAFFPFGAETKTIDCWLVANVKFSAIILPQDISNVVRRIIYIDTDRHFCYQMTDKPNTTTTTTMWVKYLSTEYIYPVDSTLYIQSIFCCVHSVVHSIYESTM